MAVITISRHFGAGGRTLGRRLAKRLGYFFGDDAVIEEIARKARVAPHSVESHERKIGSLISKVVTSAISGNYIDRLTGEDSGYIDDNSYVEILSEVVTEFAKTDNVILLGRGGQYILKDFENAYHILLVAEKKDRIKFMRTNYGMSEQAAAKAVEQGDKRRNNLYAMFARKGYDSPMRYHLSLNMSRIGMDKAAELVCSLLEEQQDRKTIS